MSMEDDTILKVLQTATTDAVAASTMPGIFVKYVGKTYKPEADTPWLEVVFIPNNRQGDFWGTEENYQGIYRLILHWPNDNQGAYAPMRLIKSICSFFTKDNLLSGVQIYDNPKLTGVLEEGSENLYPASIRYRKFQPSN